MNKIIMYNVSKYTFYNFYIFKLKYWPKEGKYLPWNVSWMIFVGSSVAILGGFSNLSVLVLYIFFSNVNALVSDRFP